VIPVPAQPYPFPLDPRRTALVVIDMQRDFIERGGFGSPSMFVGGKLFFGNDQLPVVEQELLRSAP
jgi:2-hydroxychromene-2-carboxylate isomerase